LSVLDPDFQQPASGSPTTYEAMRTPRFLYVEYADRECDLYDLRSKLSELHNRAPRLTRSQSELLHLELRRLKRCRGERRCWSAMRSRDRARMCPSAGSPRRSVACSARLAR